MDKLIQRTVEATGFCKNIVSKISSETVVTNWKFQDADNVKRNRSMGVSEKYESVVRQVIRDLFLEKKKVPSLDNILTKLRSLNVSDVVHHNLFDDQVVPAEEETIWPWGRTTLYRYMKSIGFIYDDRISYYEHTKQRPDIVTMRDNYLEWIQKYRDEGYNIYYQDETWVFKNMTTSKVWKDVIKKTTDDLITVPSGRGERSILCHVASAQTGLLDGCMLLYRGSKSNKSADYHSEMNWNVFSDCCNRIEFPAIVVRRQNSVPVADRAIYHIHR